MNAGILPDVPKGGKREGSGRKPLPPEKKRHRRILWLTDAEFVPVQDVVEEVTGERPADRKPEEEAD